MNSSLILFISILVVWISAAVLVILYFRRRGADILSPGYRVITQSAPPTFILWLEEEWRLTCFLLGITEHYMSPVPSLSISNISKASADVVFSVSANDDIENVKVRLDELTEWIEADEYKLIEAKRNRLTVRFRFGDDEFMTKTVDWDHSLRANPMIPKRVPLGVDADLNTVNVPIPGGHTLIAGNTGSGKGSVIWSIVGALSGREDTEIHGVDLKGGVEFNLGRQAFHSVATSKDEFADTIDFIFDLMEERQQRVKALETRDMPIDSDDRLTVLVIDEALDISDMDKDKDYKDTVSKFDEILRKARATGIVVIAALQNPNVSEFKWAKKFTQTIILRMSSAQQGNVLGWDSLEALDMSKIPQTIRGMALIRSETGTLTPCKVFYPDDTIVRTLPSAVLTDDDEYIYTE